MLRRPVTDSVFTATLSAGAAITLGYTLARWWTGPPGRVVFVLTGTVLLLALAALVTAGRGPRLTDRLPVFGMAVGAAIAIAIRFTVDQGLYLSADTKQLPHHWLLTTAAVLVGAALAPTPYLRRAHVPLLLAVHFALGVWLIRASPQPHIDVWVWHGEAYRALAQGLNPYALTMPNIYDETQWYAPGLADAAHVFVGHLYPPVSLLFGGLGHLLAGDYRYANLAAMTLTGACIAYARPGRLATLAAVTFLFTPRSLLVLEQGWTEAQCAFALAATVFACFRLPRAAPYLFGLMVAVKQYFIFAVPLVPLLLGTTDPKTTLRFLAKAAATGLVVTLPFVLWNPGAFFDSVVAFQGKQPYRPDSLSVLAYTAKDGAPRLPLNLCFATALVPLGLGLWRAPRTPAAFALTLATSLLAFFFFAKQAFTNYYFLVVAAFCVAAGAVTLPAEDSAVAATAGNGKPT